MHSEPSPVTPETQRRIDLLFAPEVRGEAAALLAAECGRNLPLAKDASDASVERIRFAALKQAAATWTGCSARSSWGRGTGATSWLLRGSRWTSTPTSAGYRTLDIPETRFSIGPQPNKSNRPRAGELALIWGESFTEEQPFRL